MLAALLLAAAASAAAPASPVQDEPTAGIDGRILLPSGAPAVGATWTLKGKRLSAEFERRFGRPLGWEDLEGGIGDDGRLHVTFQSHPAYQYTLRVELEGRVTSEWRWMRVGADETKKLGDVTLEPAGAITGRILGADGEALTGRAWNVRTDDSLRPPRAGDRDFPFRSSVDPETAEFTVEGLAPGPVQLKVHDLRFGWSRGYAAEVIAGRTVAVDIVLDEYEPFADRIVVSLLHVTDPMAPGPDPRHLWLVDENGERRRPQPLNANRSPVLKHWCFDDVGDGSFRFEVDDPAFDHWSEDGLCAGMAVTARVRGSAAVKLDVRDASGAVVDAYEVEVARGLGRRPMVLGSATAVDGLVDHLVAADYSIAVFAGGAAGHVDVVGLEAGEVREVRVDVGITSLARGVVTYADGEPAAGVPVRLVTPAEVDDSPGSSIWPANAGGSHPERARHEKAVATTDESGAFELFARRPGRYLLVAGETEAPRSECDAFDTSAGAAPRDVELVLQRGGTIVGRVLFPEGMSPLDRQITYMRRIDARTQAGGTQQPLLDANGRFRIGPLSPGTVDLRLLRAGRRGWSSSDGKRLGRVEVVAGEVTEVTFDYPGGVPARVHFDLTPCEIDRERVDVALAPTEGANGATIVVIGRSSVFATATFGGRAPRFGPMFVEPGTYDLWLAGEGWSAHLSEWKVEAGEVRTDVLDLDRWKRTVRFVRGGKPLVQETVFLSNAPRDLNLPSIRTDIDGWAELDLGAGRYEFSIDTGDRDLRRRIAIIDWPLGEGVEDVVFR